MTETLLIITVKKSVHDFWFPLLWFPVFLHIITPREVTCSTYLGYKTDHYPSHLYGMWRRSSVHSNVCKTLCVWHLTQVQQNAAISQLECLRLPKPCRPVQIYRLVWPQRFVGFFSCKPLNKLFGVGAWKVVCRVSAHTHTLKRTGVVLECDRSNTLLLRGFVAPEYSMQSQERIKKKKL